MSHGGRTKGRLLAVQPGWEGSSAVSGLCRTSKKVVCTLVWAGNDCRAADKLQARQGVHHGEERRNIKALASRKILKVTCTANQRRLAGGQAQQERAAAGVHGGGSAWRLRRQRHGRHGKRLQRVCGGAPGLGITCAPPELTAASSSAASKQRVFGGMSAGDPDGHSSRFHVHYHVQQCNRSRAQARERVCARERVSSNTGTARKAFNVEGFWL